MRNYSKYIDPYIKKIKNNEVEHCIEQDEMIDNIVIPVLEREDVIIREGKIEEGMKLEKYLPFKLLDWEIFLFALIAGVTFLDGEIYFDDIRIMVGRGSGKNGFIDFLCLYFLSPYHGIEGYNIDLIANSEKQVLTSFKDVYNIIKNPVKAEYAKVLKQNFSVNMEEIEGKQTKSVLRYNTSSKRGKDSKRTGCIIVDEKHEYLDETNIHTLRSGLGKVPSAREITITTDGHIREGILDRDKLRNKDILKAYDPENRTLIFWCKIEKEEEWDDMDKLVKAIPSLPYMPSLQREIKKEIRNMPTTPEYFGEFMAKRCNFPIGNHEEAVALREDIEATNQEVPDLTGLPCVGGIDYANTNDFVACVLIFRKGKKTYVLQHTFICEKSRDLVGIKAPLQEWAEKGDCEFIHDVEVSAETVAEWFAEKARKYSILKIAIDKFRYQLLNKALKAVGFDAIEKKNVVMSHKWDIIAAAPTINSLFITHSLIIGNVPIMRWYINNTKKVTMNGNVSFAKIEEHYRKTDGFMAFANGMTLYDLLPEESETKVNMDIFGIVMTY